MVFPQPSLLPQMRRRIKIKSKDMKGKNGERKMRLYPLKCIPENSMV